MIVDLIDAYVPLLKSGDLHVGTCPFCKHSRSRTGDSFVVRSSLEEWHCFNCGRGGDIYDFISQLENCSLDEAKEKLVQFQLGKVSQAIETHKDDEAAPKQPEKVDFSASPKMLAELESVMASSQIENKCVGAVLLNHQNNEYAQIGSLSYDLARSLDGYFALTCKLSETLFGSSDDEKGLKQSLVFSSGDKSLLQLKIEAKTLVLLVEQKDVALIRIKLNQVSFV